MKISEKWLREWVNPNWSTDELVAEITMAGLEVDAVEGVASDFSGVVVAEIIAIEPHPDADKLRVCQVACGEDAPVQVVCGASNARLGLKAPFAKVGAVLKTPDNDDFKIKKAKLRGVPSFGMLCGASELGMEDAIDGLMELAADAPVGEDLRQYLDLNDKIIDVDLTPNRGDCLSILGVARDVGVLSQTDLTPVEINDVAAVSQAVFPVDIQAPDDCPSYASRVIKGVDLSAKTPQCMVEKLNRSGIRSIDAVVDVTNYVLLELGQPMHAFDLAALDGGIVVRHAKEGEKITLLDEQEISLAADSLVIADQSKALALAGIMGGADSGVSPSTQDILLESAFFTPINIAGRARAFGLHTDSSHRFERGVDLANQKRAIERATALLLDIVGGEPGPTVLHGQQSFEARIVSLSKKRLFQVLGCELAESQVDDILTRLGLGVTFDGETWTCTVPSWRFDISIQADLIEEIARIYGYNKLPTRQLRVPVNFVKREERISPIGSVKRHMAALGYQEAITYSFIEPELQQLFSDEAPVAVANPISADMSVMRTSLLPGLVKAMQHNLNRQISRMKLFETGLQFHQSDADSTGAQQQPFIAGLIIGESEPESWVSSKDAFDFYHLKGDVESLLGLTRQQSVTFEACERKGLHPGQTAIIKSEGKTLGYIGKLHPETAKTLSVTGQAYLFELSLTLTAEGNVSSFKSLSKFPQVRRDVALVVDNTITSQAVESVIRDSAGEHLINITIFDVYTGKGIDDGKKSLALALHFQHSERSLEDAEVQEAVDAAVARLHAKLSAQLR